MCRVEILMSNSELCSLPGYNMKNETHIPGWWQQAAAPIHTWGHEGKQQTPSVCCAAEA